MTGLQIRPRLLLVAVLSADLASVHICPPLQAKRRVFTVIRGAAKRKQAGASPDASSGVHAPSPTSPRASVSTARMSLLLGLDRTHLAMYFVDVAPFERYTRRHTCIDIAPGGVRPFAAIPDSIVLSCTRT